METLIAILFCLLFFVGIVVSIKFGPKPKHRKCWRIYGKTCHKNDNGYCARCHSEMY